MLAIRSLYLLILLAPPQAPDPDEIRVRSQTYMAHPAALHVETNLVEIGVVVRDNSGHAISGLTKENFQIRDQGKEREIAGFSLDSGATANASAIRPRFVALYFDDVNSKGEQHANDLKQTREAVEKLVKESLHPGVKIGVFTASGAPTLDFTSDSAILIQAIASVQSHGRLAESGASVCPAVTPYIAYLIAVRNDRQAAAEVAYQCRGTEEVIGAQAAEVWRRAKELSAETLDSVRRLVDHLEAMPGTRVLLLASSGFLTATLEHERDAVVGQALHAGVIVNSLDSKGLDGWKPVEPTVALSGTGVAAGLAHRRFEEMQSGLRIAAMNEPLAALADGTGGLFFHDNNDLDTGFRELAYAPEITYRLSFRLPEGAVEGSYHKLGVKVLNAKYKSVQSRPGYFAPVRRTDANPASRFEKEMLAADTIEEFPVKLIATNTRLASGEVAVAVVANVDIAKLRFGKEKDRWTQRLRLATALLDSQGAIVAAKEATMDLAMKEGTYTRFAKTGLNAKLTLQVPPGVYNLREVVQDIEGEMACSMKSIEVR